MRKGNNPIMTRTPQDIADCLAGKRVQFIHSHPLSGALIELGDLTLRPKPLKNDTLPYVERLYEGSSSVFIQSKLVLHSRSRLLLDGRRASGDEVWQLLDYLVGHVLVEAEISNPSLDLTLRFDNDMQVAVETNRELGEIAKYSVRIGGYYWSANNGHISEEQH